MYLILATLLLSSPPLEKVSEALGHVLSKQLEELHLDMDALAKGMKNQAKGIEAPLSPEDCLFEIAKLQEKKIQEIEQNNLIEAEEFLAKNKKNNQINTIENGKLQFEVTKSGSGETLQGAGPPLVRLSGRYIDGTFFQDEQTETFFNFEEANSLFKAGLIGMAEGEKRTLYVHPSLGLADLEPNALQIFEVELLKVDTTSPQIALEPTEQKIVR